MRFAEGTTCAGVFTRHGVGSAPVDWCQNTLAATGGANVRAVVVNAGGLSYTLTVTDPKMGNLQTYVTNQNGSAIFVLR